ncbi:serine carboxypeptidase-like protein 26 [Tanacetum coccineum]
MSTPLIILFFLVLCSEAKYLQPPMNQGSKLIEFRLSQVQQWPNPVPESKPDIVTDHHSLAARIRESQSYANKEDHFLKEGLPSQPSSTLGLKQFAGNLAVDVMSGRSLFYYHVESQLDSASKQLVLWLNGGCASLVRGFAAVFVIRMVLKGIAKVDIGPCDVGLYGKVMVLFDGAEVEVRGMMNSDLAGKLGFICFGVNRVTG